MDIVVLCGGTSTEREVSISSGVMVCNALRSMNHNAVLIDIYYGSSNPSPFLDAKYDYDADAEGEKLRKLSKNPADRKEVIGYFGLNVVEICQHCDIVFMALHGKYGEDGTCQAAFDMLGIRYTGSSFLPSAIGMDKGISKSVLLEKGIPMAKSIWLKPEDDAKLSQNDMDFPVVVKACNGGSSVGVFIVEDEGQYISALNDCFKLCDEVLVEEYISGREFSVGVIDKKALPVVEIVPKSGWYDYENKYSSGACDEICPAKLSEEEREKMQKIAVDSYNAIGCSPYARIDVMMDKNKKMYCLEVNTLPGMTKTSLVPKEAKEVGMDFPHLCDKLVRLSLERYK